MVSSSRGCFRALLLSPGTVSQYSSVGVGTAVVAWGTGWVRGKEQGCGQPVPFFLTHASSPSLD